MIGSSLALVRMIRSLPLVDGSREYQNLDLLMFSE